MDEVENSECSYDNSNSSTHSSMFLDTDDELDLHYAKITRDEMIDACIHKDFATFDQLLIVYRYEYHYDELHIEEYMFRFIFDYAFKNQMFETIQYLISKHELEIQVQNLRHIIVSEDYFEFAKRIIETYNLDSKLSNAIFDTSLFGNFKLLEYLIETHRADVFKKNDDGDYAIIVAINALQRQHLMWFLSKNKIDGRGIDPDRFKDICYFNHESCQKHRRIIEFLWRQMVINNGDYMVDMHGIYLQIVHILDHQSAEMFQEFTQNIVMI